MIFDSMKGLDDLPSMFQCNNGNQTDISKYSTLKMNITHLPTALISGLCLPAEGTPEKLTDFSNSASAKINGILSPLLEYYVKEPMGLGFLNKDTQAYLTITQSEYQAEQWQDSVRPGFIASIVLCTIIVFALVIVPNGYYLKLHYQGKAKENSATPRLDWAFRDAP